MSSGVFRGKESSNRIELSQLVQDLLNFDDLGSLWLWGCGVGGNWGWGWLGVPPTHVHMHMHAHTHTHACMVNMIISCKWPPLLNIGYILNETNTEVCMYIEEFILVEIWIHCCRKLK